MVRNDSTIEYGNKTPLYQRPAKAASSIVLGNLWFSGVFYWDLTMTYSEKLKDPRWRAKREEIFELKGRVCAQCSSELDIEVHHMTYTTTNPWDEPNEHLLPLCECCHLSEHIKQRHGDKIDLNHAAMLGGFTPLDMRRIQNYLEGGEVHTHNLNESKIAGEICVRVFAKLEAQREYHGI